MRFGRSFLALALAAGFVLAGGASRAATWQGDTLNVQLLQPNPQTVAFNGNFIAPPGSVNIFNSAILRLGIDTNSVTFQNVADYGFDFPSSTIIKISDLTASPILNVQVDPASTITLRPGSLISGANFLQFDLQQANVPPSSFLNLVVGFTPGLGEPAPVPEPASLVLLGAGLFGLCLARRQRSSTA